MEGYRIVKLSLRSAVLAVLKSDGRVFALNLDSFETIKELRYMMLDDILTNDNAWNMLYFEVIKDE